MRRIRVEPDAVVVEDETSGADAVSTLVLARDADVVAATEPVREPRVLAERLGERRRVHALVQRGTPAPSWRIAIRRTSG